MKSKSIILIIASIFFIASCKEEKKYPIEKKYWDVADYENIVTDIKYGRNPDEKLPTFDNPETQQLLEKLTDQENFKVVLDDKELGVKHKNEVAQAFFKIWKDMNSIYTEIDRQDKYIYEREYVEIYNFGLELQIRYFSLGNDEIIEDSDDPNSEQVKQVTNSNINALVGNFLIYLDEINTEKSYTDVGLNLISKGIDKSFTELVNLYPKHNYDNLTKKIDLMLNKTKSKNIKESLTKLKQLIDSKKQMQPTIEKPSV